MTHITYMIILGIIVQPEPLILLLTKQIINLKTKN